MLKQQQIQLIALTPFLFLALTPFALFGCSQVTHHVSRLHLGTVVNITIITDSHDHAAKAAEAAFVEISRIEMLMSPVLKGDVFRINKEAEDHPVTVSDETFAVIHRAKEIWQETAGAFDITFASISKFWDFNRIPFIPPQKNIIQKYLYLVNSDNLLLDARNKTVKFAKKHMKIGLGGIAKGFAILRAIEILRAQSITNAIVEAGGDLMVIGSKGSEQWRVGLAHPRAQEILSIIDLSDGCAIATSGDYERFAMHRATRFHHILDPKTGFPANRCISVSVICSDPVSADAYATAFFVLGKERAFEIIKKKGNLEAIIIEPDMRIYASESLKKRMHMLLDMKINWIK